MRIHDPLTFLALKDRRDLLFYYVICERPLVIGGSLCGNCWWEALKDVSGKTWDNSLRLYSEPAHNRACARCRR